MLKFLDRKPVGDDVTSRYPVLSVVVRPVSLFLMAAIMVNDFDCRSWERCLFVHFPRSEGNLSPETYRAK